MWLLLVTIVDIGIFNDSVTSQQFEMSSYQRCVSAAHQIKNEQSRTFRRVKTSCVKK